MKLLSIECEYFRQHVDSRISFSPGLTGIVGANGAGKSTLVEAISFALFGSRAVRGRIEDIVTRGVKRKKPLVRLRFEHGGHGFLVERSTTRTTLFIGGSREPMVSGGRQVTEKIQEILGLNFEEFIATYFTEQKGLEFLSGKRGATERSRFIIQMMGYDKLERAQELLRKDRRDLKSKISGIESSLHDERVLKEQVESEEAALRITSAAAVASAVIVEESLADFLKQESDWRALEKQKTEFDLAQSKYDATGVRLEAATEQVTTLIEQRDRLNVELTSLEKQLVKWDGDSEVFTTEYEAVQNMLAEQSSLCTQLGQQWEADRVQAASAEGVQRAQCENEQVALSELRRLEHAAECPTCGQQLGTAYLETLQSKAAQYTRTCEAHTELIKKLTLAKEKPATLREAEETLETLTHTEESLKDCARYFARLTELKTEQASLAERIEGKQSEIAQLQIVYATIKKELQRSGFSTQKYAEKKLAYETARQLLEVNRMNRLRHENTVEKQQALLDRSMTTLKNAKDARVQLDAQKRELLLLDEADAAFTDIRQLVNASIRPRLADLASEFLADLTDGRYASVEIGADFTPTVFEDGEPKPIISGGEQDILNLCVRLALSQLVAERAGHAISLLVLDEVFGSLDENRRYNVLMLLDKLQNRFDQVLLITHLDDIKEGVHHFINVEYDEGSGEVRIDALDSYETLAMNI